MQNARCKADSVQEAGRDSSASSGSCTAGQQRGSEQDQRSLPHPHPTALLPKPHGSLMMSQPQSYLVVACRQLSQRGHLVPQPILPGWLLQLHLLPYALTPQICLLGLLVLQPSDTSIRALGLLLTPVPSISLHELLNNFDGELERLLTTWCSVPFLSCPSCFGIVCLSWLLALYGGLWFLPWLWSGLCTADCSFLLEDCRDAVR